MTQPVPSAAGGSGDFETRTLLFSDIEGSTRLLSTLGDTYPIVLATHRDIVRSAVLAHGGQEHATDGDGFFFMFHSAREGLTAAVDTQLALNAHEWPEGVELRVRMGLHAGEVGWSEGDVVGMAVHEAARIAAAAHGGQLLVSALVRDLTSDVSPERVSLRSLGRYRLKDIAQPIELFQACHPDLPSDFPVPRTRDVVVDLPTPRTLFVGRGQDIADVLALLAAGRHVTLTGVGGSGKTRLAVEVAVRDADRYPDGVFFVDLAPVADPDLVLGALATAVNVQGDGPDLEAMLLSYLSDRKTLIVLDNCEHLIDACADVVDLILGACRSISILATSRESLQIDGEQTFRVPSLSLDDTDSAAVELFVSRARAVRTDFQLTENNQADVLAICRRLDGIPLAIELAAARVSQLGTADIARRLDARFELLVGGSRRRVQRQQTLQATMDWSWTLLSDDERRFLRRLAVFAGPFDAAAAAAVCNEPRAEELLGALITKSLITVEEAFRATRYRLLETVRLYAQDRLVESGEAAECRDAHRDLYLARVEAITLDQALDLDLLAYHVDDYGNHRAALDWSTAQGRADLLGRHVPRIAFMCDIAPALWDELARWLLQIADDEEQSKTARADALWRWRTCRCFEATIHSSGPTRNGRWISTPATGPCIRSRCSHSGAGATPPRPRNAMEARRSRATAGPGRPVPPSCSTLTPPSPRTTASSPTPTEPSRPGIVGGRRPEPRSPAWPSTTVPARSRAPTRPARRSMKKRLHGADQSCSTVPPSSPWRSRTSAGSAKRARCSPTRREGYFGIAIPSSPMTASSRWRTSRFEKAIRYEPQRCSSRCSPTAASAITSCTSSSPDSSRNSRPRSPAPTSIRRCPASSSSPPRGGGFSRVRSSPTHPPQSESNERSSSSSADASKQVTDG